MDLLDGGRLMETPMMKVEMEIMEPITELLKRLIVMAKPTVRIHFPIVILKFNLYQH
jgi:hypothetical protein